MACVALTAVTPSPAAAQNWIGNTSTDWTDGSNWSGGVVPTTGEVNIDTTSPNPTVLGGGATGTSDIIRVGATNGGSGNLTIQDGSALTSDFARIGNVGGSTGVVTVTGAGSTWTINPTSSNPNDNGLVVGNAGTGTLTISNAASVSVNAPITGFVIIGRTDAGVGTLNITSGGTLTNSGNGTVGFRASGTATVSGTGSQWTVGSILFIGREGGGTGTLTIEDGGTVTTQARTRGTDVAFGAGTTGTLNINSGGTLETFELRAGSGTAQANFDGGTLRATDDNMGFITGFPGTELNIEAGGLTIDDAGFTIATDTTSAFTGTGALTKIGSGTLILESDSTYGGGTMINAGTLQLGNGGTTGSIVGDVTNNGTLAFNRSNTYTFDGVITENGGVSQIGSGTTILTAANTYTGPTTIDAGTLLVNGSIQSPTTVNSGGTLGGNGTIFNDVFNFGTVAPGAFIGTLTIVGNYVGNGGTLEIETVLGGDNSPTDQLVIDGGIATGNTTVNVINQGGAGAVTNIGIPIIVAEDTTTMEPTAFSLGGPVVAGLYQYQLYQGTPDGSGTAQEEQSWYLRNTTQGPNPQPLTRPEAPIYGIAPGMARALNITAIGTFHERNGDQRLAQDNSPGWGRVFGHYREHGHSGTLSERFKGHAAGLQAGLDLARWERPDGSERRAGVMFAFAGARGDVHGLALATADRYVGTVRLSSFNAGTYWTHIGPDGGYLDAVLMGSIYDGSGTSTNRIGVSVEGWGVTASLEAGYPIPLGTGFTFEPQAQLIWQHVSLEGRDAFTDIDYNVPSAAWHGRLGARLAGGFAAGGMDVRPYLKANMIADWAGSHETIFAKTHRINTGKDVMLAEVGGGFTAQLTPTVGIWGVVDYSTEISGGDESREIWRGNAGLRVLW